MNTYAVSAVVSRKPTDTEELQTFTVQARDYDEALDRFFYTFDDAWAVKRVTRVEIRP